MHKGYKVSFDTCSFATVALRKPNLMSWHSRVALHQKLYDYTPWHTVQVYDLVTVSKDEAQFDMGELVQRHVEEKGRRRVLVEDDTAGVDGDGDFGENGAFVAGGGIDADGVGEATGEGGGEVEVVGAGGHEGVGSEKEGSFSAFGHGSVFALVEAEVSGGVVEVVGAEGVWIFAKVKVEGVGGAGRVVVVGGKKKTVCVGLVSDGEFDGVGDHGEVVEHGLDVGSEFGSVVVAGGELDEIDVFVEFGSWRVGVILDPKFVVV